MKKVRVIVPVTTEMWNEPVLKELEACKEPDTEVVVTNLNRGTVSIEDSFDATWAGPFVLRAVIEAEQQGFDGVIVYCFDDPGVRGAKEAVRIPVVGIGEASAHVAAFIGHKFGIVTAGIPQKTCSVIWDNLRMYELDHKCVGVKPVGVPVLRLKEDIAEEERNLTELSSELIAKGAEVIVLGCGSMLGVADAVSKRLQVPIVVPARAALKVCEGLIAMRLSQSKLGFATPLDKERTG